VGKPTTASRGGGLAARGHRVLLIDAIHRAISGTPSPARPAHTYRASADSREFDSRKTDRARVRERLDIDRFHASAFSLERRLAGETQRETIWPDRLCGLDRL